MDHRLLFTVRVVLSLVWLYNGLWLKVLVVDSHHLEIVSPIARWIGMDSVVLLKGIGALESLLALGIISGLFSKFVSCFQIAVILTMNCIGAVFGDGAIQHPFGLIISNLPTTMCALVVAVYGPGAYALKLSEILRSYRRQ